MSLCNLCDSDPCTWTDICEEVVDHVEGQRNTVQDQNNLLRKYGYQKAVEILYGVLGRGNRVQLPKCVVNGIRNKYPDDNGEYMGYKDY